MQSGSPHPLGATCDGMGTNFAVFSAHAERIELCLFDPSGKREIARYDLPECTDEIWHGYLPRVRGGTLYGFRAHGPYQPEEGHRFNPNKLLLDPYARLLHGQVRWSDALHGYRVASPRADLSFDRRDSAAAMPKAVVVDEPMHWTANNRPHTPWNETIIYETHLKGFTRTLKRIRQHERGTFIALADPYVIDYLVKLGITAVELLPVHAFVQDRRLAEMKLRNYWGYNTLAFFAPEPSYLAEGALNEIRAAVQALHAAGIEVILDVVYNHTCEGSELGTTMSFRGLDNKSYYRLMPDNPRYCINDTGTGNTVNTAHPRVLQLVMDSLRYWVQTFHIDGFRFDLGVSLGREEHGFDPCCGLFDAMRQDPVLANVKLISEPWDIGPGGYQLGHHPPSFAEWNDKFRDTTRRFWRGDAGQRPDLAARLSGSGDLFDRRARRPWASINMLTAHDGMTLNDVVSYDGRHNEANGENGQDGHSENYSRNWGAEGPTDDQAVQETRDRVRRSMLTTLMTSLGTPMLLGGDEFGRTQGGNNNAYCQDNVISWFDWALAASPQGQALSAFTARLIALRKAHPLLRAGAFLYGQEEVVPGVLDIEWFDERGERLSPDDWQNPEGRALLMRRARRLPDGELELIALALNGADQILSFVLPSEGLALERLVDSADPQAGLGPVGQTLELPGGAAVLLRGVGAVA
jgi:glycogen operon protein